MLSTTERVSKMTPDGSSNAAIITATEIAPSTSPVTTLKARVRRRNDLASRS